jgi:hypothetical protein
VVSLCVEGDMAGEADKTTESPLNMRRCRSYWYVAGVGCRVCVVPRPQNAMASLQHCV